jgi:toxin ParE1/3/4
MKVTFDPAARDELDGIYAWIAKDNPRAALEMIVRIEAKVMRLEIPRLTHMGRPGLIEGTRELIEWPYSSSIKSFKIEMKLLSSRSFTELRIATFSEPTWTVPPAACSDLLDRQENATAAPPAPPS